MSLESISAVTVPAIPTSAGVDAPTLRKRDAEPAVKPVAPQQEQSVKAAQKLSQQEEDRLKEVTKEFNDFIKHFGTQLDFSIDDGSGQTVVKVLNKQTGELIRQIPSDEMLKAAKAMDTLRGILIRGKA